MEVYCKVVDTLVMARDMYPGQRNTLDALCKRYDINNSHRTLHGALLDSEILADVYLAMTGGQVNLALQSVGSSHAEGDTEAGGIRRIRFDTSALPIIQATETELAEHQERLAAIEKAGGKCLWGSL